MSAGNESVQQGSRRSQEGVEVHRCPDSHPEHENSRGQDRTKRLFASLLGKMWHVEPVVRDGQQLS